jgi:hypothetical protein
MKRFPPHIGENMKRTRERVKAGEESVANV